MLFVETLSLETPVGKLFHPKDKKPQHSNFEKALEKMLEMNRYL
jgi:hypothetical protein